MGRRAMGNETIYWDGLISILVIYFPCKYLLKDIFFVKIRCIIAELIDLNSVESRNNIPYICCNFCRECPTSKMECICFTAVTVFVLFHAILLLSFIVHQSKSKQEYFFQHA